MSTNAKILVVDDDHAILSATRRTLEAAGYDTLGAPDGEAALQAVREYRPDLILLDVNLPHMDGFEVCRRVKADPALADAFVIMLSSIRTDSDSHVDGLDTGADGYIARPIANRELLARVQAMLRIQKVEKALRQSEQRFRSLSENALAGIFIFQDGHIVYANPAMANIFGYAPDELVGADPALIVHPDDFAQLMEQIRRRISGEDQNINEFRGLTKTGEIKVVEVLGARAEFDGRPAIIGNILDVTERKRAQEELLRLNRIYAVITQVNQMMVRAREQDEIFANVCRIAIEFGKFRMAWIGLVDESTRKVEPVAWEGVEDGYLTRIKIVTTNDVPAGRGPTGSAVYKRNTICCNDIASDPRMAPWREAALQRGYRSSIALPIVVRGKGIGALTIYAAESFFFNAAEIDLLEEVTSDIAYALEMINGEMRRSQAEEKLRESEKRYRDLFENAGLAIFQVTLDGKPLAVNSEFVRMFGYASADDFMATIQNSAHVFAEPLRRAEVLRLKAENPNLASFENLYRRKDGSTFTGQMMMRQIQDPQGGTLYFEGMIEDTTVRKQVEAALRESEKIYHNLFNNTQVGMFRTRLDGSEILDANDKFLEIFGCTREETIGKSSVIHWAIPAWREEMVSRLKADGRVFDFEAKMINKNGEVRDCVTSLNLYPEEGILDGSILDITERKRAEDAIALSEARYRSLVETQAEVVSRSDPSGNLSFVNDSYCHTFGISREQALGTDFRSTVFPEDLPLILAELDAIKQPPYRKYIEIRNLTPQGVRWFGWDNSSVLDVQGQIVEMQGVGRDITERRRAEEEILTLNTELEHRVEQRTQELRDAQEQLVRQEKLAVLGQLAGGVGHELRNPLTIISNAVFYLRMVQPDVDEKVKEYLGIIDAETRTAEKIISDLLDFSRVKSVDAELLVVSDLLGQVLERFPTPANVSVRLKLPESLPAVYADSLQMTQVLGNLVVNACQAMPEGGRLAISAAEKGKEIAIAVKDTGVGIPPENMKKLFEPLFTTKSRGIGLGLAVSRKLAEANGGRIEVHSEPGQGSTFTLYLPLKAPTNTPKDRLQDADEHS